MEIEENRGLIHKKAFEDQWVSWVSLVLELSLYSIAIILLDTFLDHSWRVWHTWSFGARSQRRSMKSQEDIGTNNYNGFWLQVLSYMYVFLTSFAMHGTCMWFLGYDISLAWRISWIDSGFAYPCHFLDSHGVVGFPTCFFFIVGA